MSILCIGQAAFDITFPVKEEIVENQKYRILNKIECMGGPAANAAYLCALWGACTYLQARVGKDLYGQKIMTILDQAGVNTSCMYMDEHFETSISAIIANQKNGHRTIFNCPGILKPITFDRCKDSIDVILVDGHEPQASLQALENYPSAISIIDAGTYRDSMAEIASKVDYLICSQDFVYQYTGINVSKNESNAWRSIFQKMHTLNLNHVVITLGEEGLVYEDPQGIHAMNAFCVNAVDTCGAGDIFHGAFAYCIDQKQSLEEALKISSMTAAISVESYGSQCSIPQKSIVNQRLLKEKEAIKIL